MRTRPTLPAGHGELLVSPDLASWPDLVASNRVLARSWDFDVAGMPADELRDLARCEGLASAARFSERLGVSVAEPGDAASPIVMTGHQPELYHPGVWLKDFLLQRVARELGATALDIVVDTDGFDSVSATVPCKTPTITRCHQYLSLGEKQSCYACTPVPSPEHIEQFCAATASSLSTLSAPALSRHFANFCAALRAAAADAQNLSELVTFARRRYEEPAGSDYLELPVTSLVECRAFARFLVALAFAAPRFASDYNAELASYRMLTSTRSAAQPFPDLAVDGDAVELPFWEVDGGRRRTVWARRQSSGGVDLVSDDRIACSMPNDADGAVDALLESASLFAPKALALTMFLRTFVADLFIHGVGGGRYDRVTDGVIRRFFGVEPPASVVASLTLYLPLGVHPVDGSEVAAATERLNRLAHNPDSLLEVAEFETPAERERAGALAARKAELVARIAEPDADKKSLGVAIREVNAELAALLAPVRREMEADVERLTALRDASEILTDRTYPFCFWDPSEVADKAW